MQGTQALQSSGNTPPLNCWWASLSFSCTRKFCACACEVCCTIILTGGSRTGSQSAGQEGLRSSGAAGVTLDAVPTGGPAAGTTANSGCVPIVICLKTSERRAQASPDLPVRSPLLHPVSGARWGSENAQKNKKPHTEGPPKPEDTKAGSHPVHAVQKDGS